MSIHSWTILSLTKVKVIHVTGTKIHREPILGKLLVGDKIEFLATRWGRNHLKTPDSDLQHEITPI